MSRVQLIIAHVYRIGAGDLLLARDEPARLPSIFSFSSLASRKDFHVRVIVAAPQSRFFLQVH